jgi:hypothetical protein
MSGFVISSKRRRLTFGMFLAGLASLAAIGIAVLDILGHLR